ncbi:MAG: trypsin-like peptidase domain-containing protein [Gammaproteobacteria bacterium]|nr:trypsin-like peptidase domain-containing protein [Gammaproteobacteria bacterium]
MGQIIRFLQFVRWPVFTGILIAIVLLQYQQLQQLSEFRELPVTPPPQTSQQLSFPDAINRAAPAVVSINATTVNVESFEQTSTDRINLYLGERASLGSGVIISPEGFILTNLHVVESLLNMFDTVVTLKDGRSIPATVVAYDEANDLAILHINMDNLTPIPVGNDDTLNVGDLVFAIGYPRNIGQSVSQGIVSALGDNKEGSGGYLIQTDAAINPGNSGGALIDRNGNLIGINSSIFSESGRFEGIGFATPVSTAMRIMEELVTEAVANNPGYLGVLTGEVLNQETSELFFGVPDIRGMLVENVDNGGPAQRAGILPGDVITQVENSPVIDEETIMMEFQNKQPGDQVMVQVYREGQRINLPTILGFGQAMVIAP